MNLLFAILLTALAQIIVWFQLNAQFKWTWAADNRILIAAIVGIPLSIMFVYATDMLYQALDKQVWTVRLSSFGIGVITFYALSATLLGEEISLKNGVCLFLSILIILIQILWK